MFTTYNQSNLILLVTDNRKLQVARYFQQNFYFSPRENVHVLAEGASKFRSNMVKYGLFTLVNMS